MVEVSWPVIARRCILRGAGPHPVAVPARPMRSLDVEDVHVLWLGPDEFLVLGRVFAEGVDVSHRQVALVLEGAGAEPLLNGAVPIDLSVAAFPVGMCSRTILGKVEIVLWRRDAAVWHIEVARSLAPYAQALLDTIGAASG